MIEVILKRFEHPDELRSFEQRRFELVTLGGMTIGLASYEPGWRWSTHVGTEPDISLHRLGAAACARK
jgi:hypothetical protein